MKEQIRTKTNHRIITLVLVMVMLLTPILGVVSALAANPIFSPITIRWESKDIDRTFSAQELADDFTLVGPFDYSAINRFGTWEENSGVSGIKVIDFLEAVGVDTNALEPNRFINILSSDGFNVDFMWSEITEPRYSWTNPSSITGQDNMRQRDQVEEVPFIINFTVPSNRIPRNQMGLTYPSEQTRDRAVRTTTTITVTDRFATPWRDPHVFIQGQSTLSEDALASGSVVQPGTMLRITSPDGDSGTTKYFYTLNGTDPHPNNPDARAFNWNSFSPDNTVNPAIVVPNPEPGQRQFVIKTANFGGGRIPSQIMTYTYNYPFATNSAFLTGPSEVNIDQTNEIVYTVNAANITNINFFVLKLSYDADKLDYDDVSLTLPADFGAWIIDEKHNAVAGEIELTISGVRDKVITSENNVAIADLKFTLKDSLAEDDVIRTELLSVSLINPVTGAGSNAVISDAVVNTTVTVDEVDPLLKYDINGDGVYDLIDLSIIIYRYFMVASGEALWASASTYDHLDRNVIDTANIIALYSLIP